MRILFLFFLSLIVYQTQSQSKANSFILMNAVAIDGNRYIGIKGNPYYFEEFQLGRIISKQLDIHNRARLNYNIYSKNLELVQDGIHINLDRSNYWRIEFKKEDNPSMDIIPKKDKIVLQKDIHEKFEDRMVELVYEGNRVQLIKDMASRIAEVRMEAVGRTEKFKRFAQKEQYYFLVDGQLQFIKPKIRGFTKTFNYDKQLLDYIIKENINPSEESDLHSFSVYWDGILEKDPIPHKN